MLAAVYHGPDDLRLEDYPMPSIGADEALLKVVSAGICGTDLRILHGGHRKFPSGTIRIPGHEVVGDIVEIGAHIKASVLDQRVIVAPNWGCGHCRQCISGNNNRCANYGAVGITEDGAFAEYMRIPAAAMLQGNLIPVHRTVDPAQAALVEPLACVLRGQTAVHLSVNDVVLVIGGGPIGIMHVMLAKLQGARRVILSETHPERRVKAAQVGADRVVNPREEDLNAVVMDETSGEGADVIITAVGSQSIQETAIRLAAIGGRINFFGGLPKDRPTIQLDSNVVHYKELYLTGTTACSTADCWRAAQIIQSGRLNLNDVIRSRFPLSQAKDAFAMADNKTALKIVLEPSPAAETGH